MRYKCYNCDDESNVLIPIRVLEEIESYHLSGPKIPSIKVMHTRDFCPKCFIIALSMSDKINELEE